MSDFDQQIRQRLEGHSTGRPADAWDRFARRWPEDATAEDPAFDTFLRQKLEHFQVRHAESLRQQRWEQVRQSLDLIRDRIRELWLAKAMELSLAFLLCFFWWAPVLDQPGPQPVVPDSGPRAELRLPAGNAAPDQLSPSTATTFRAAGELSGVQLVPPMPSGPAGGASAIAAESSGAVVSLPFPNAGDPASADQEEEADRAGTAGSGSTPERASLALPELLPLRVAALDMDSDPSLLDQARLTPPRRRFFHRVSMALLGDLHYVMTPYDHLLIKRGYDQLATGYGAAMGYTWEGRRWGLRAQLTYRHLYYLPKPYTEVFDGDVQRGYFTESIRNIELNLVSAGIQVSRQLVTTGRWRWYALTGGSLHMAVLANYDRKQKHLPGSDPLLPGEIPQPQHPSRISQKRFADGFLEGGNLEENYYLSLDIGAGVERHLNGRISLFAEPVYHHNPFQKSLGPNRDRLSTLTVFSGIRVLL